MTVYTESCNCVMIWPSAIRLMSKIMTVKGRLNNWYSTFSRFNESKENLIFNLVEKLSYI